MISPNSLNDRKGSSFYAYNKGRKENVSLMLNQENRIAWLNRPYSLISRIATESYQCVIHMHESIKAKSICS